MERNKIWVLLIAAFLGMIVLAACSSGSTPSEGLTVRASEFRFTPETIALKVGEPAQLTVTNVGNVQHTFTIPDLEVNLILASGQTLTADFTPTESGSFELLCTVPGHKEAGMVATVEVSQ